VGIADRLDLSERGPVGWEAAGGDLFKRPVGARVGCGGRFGSETGKSDEERKKGHGSRSVLFETRRSISDTPVGWLSEPTISVC
jgi:hypothetical protein